MVEQQVSMTLNMKVIYKVFITQFQKLNSRLDDMDKQRRGVTQAIFESSKRGDPRHRHHSDFNCEPSEKESNGVELVRNRRARNRGRQDSNINAIKMQIPLFKGRNDGEAYFKWERKVEMIFACQAKVGSL